MVPGVLYSFCTFALFLAVTASESEGEVEVPLQLNRNEKPQGDNLNQSTPTGVIRHGETAPKPELAARTGVMDTNFTLSGGQDGFIKITKKVNTSGLNVTETFEHQK